MISPQAQKGFLFAFLLIVVGGLLFEFGIQLFNTPGAIIRENGDIFLFFIGGGASILLGLLIGLFALGA